MQTGRQDWRWGAALTLGAMGLALLGLNGCATGGYPPPKPPTPQPAPVVTFAVAVTDAQTGAAIEGARVDVQWTATEDDGRTNADGYWSGLAPAYTGFVVQVHADGYDMGEATIPALYDNRREAIMLSPSVRPPWPGRLAIGPDARCFVDGSGACQLPVLAHYGEAFSAYVRRPEAVRAQLRAIKAAGYDGIRFWDTLGYYSPPWNGKEVMPWDFTNRPGERIAATPDYYDQLRAFLLDVKAAGLVVHHSRGDLNGQPNARVVEHAGRVARIYDEIGWEPLALAEGANEDFQNGDFRPDGLRRIVAPFKARGAITALSAPPGTSEEPGEILAYSADVFYVHGHRTGGHVDIIRHIFSLAREQLAGVPRLGWQGEPAGPGSGVTVGQVNDREALALMAAESLMSRQAWVYMSSHGVFWNGPIESQPGFAAVPRIAAAIEQFAPDVMSWRLTHRSAPDAALVSDKPRESHARVDQVIAPDGRVVANVYDDTGRQSVQNTTPRPLSCDVLGVADDESLTRATVTVPPGGWLPLEYRVGRLLLCSPVH